ncbi:hypothetical protein [Nocardioides sp.]|uniref:hypothetical protein n=1 Tax=Nocardioides sp. TaxID=35761 RepID=UPI003518DB19
MTSPASTFLGAPAPGEIEPFVMPELWRIGADGVVHRLTVDGWVDEDRPVPPGLHRWRLEDADRVLAALIGSRTVAPWCYPDAQPRPSAGRRSSERPAVEGVEAQPVADPEPPVPAAPPTGVPLRSGPSSGDTVPGERRMWRIFWLAMLVTVIVLVLAQCSGRR